MATRRPSHLVIAAEGAGLAIAAAVMVKAAPSANWNLALFAVLFFFAAISDLTAVATPSRVHISGSFMAIVLAMVLLGGTPAALIGLAAICVGWRNGRAPFHYFFNNVLTYALFPLAGGMAFHAAKNGLGLDSGDVGFYLVIVGIFIAALLVNFTMIAGYAGYVEQRSFWADARRVLAPVLPSELAAALMAVAVSYIYCQAGVAGLAMFVVVLVIFQHLIGSLLFSQRRAEELERRTA